MRGRGGGHVPKGSEERHEEQTDRNRRTSIRVGRRFPIDVSNSGGSSVQTLVAIFLFEQPCLLKPSRGNGGACCELNLLTAPGCALGISSKLSFRIELKKMKLLQASLGGAKIGQHSQGRLLVDQHSDPLQGKSRLFIT